ncbi:hypothetical protein SeMB42_g05005 [Synchytrium endobioticum]|uniref:Uncharacterized protein n=1 Tax=Synchytrium endobioticum TaxID=286115 RepID=A0A507CUB0_9FUNG|nr:hypothetical protein SeMB42_g05005 [Synchytrium endobioticum]
MDSTRPSCGHQVHARHGTSLWSKLDCTLGHHICRNCGMPERAGSSAFQKSILSSAVESLRSRKLQNLVKGVLSYLVGFIMVFSEAARLRLTVYSNLLVICIIVTPAATVGAFRDSALQSLVGIGLGAAAWAFIAVASNGSTIAYGVYLLLIIYPLNVTRALLPRLFGLTVIASLMAFQGVSFTFTSAGGKFNDANRTQLLHTMAAFSIGLAINWVINTFVFPDFAETDLKDAQAATMKNFASLIELISRSYLLDTPIEEQAIRQRNVATMRSSLSQIAQRIVEADAEIFYSEMDMDDYEQIQTHLTKIAQHIASIDAALTTSLGSLNDSEIYRHRFATPLKESLVNVSASLESILIDAREKLLGYGHTSNLQRRLSNASTYGACISQKRSPDDIQEPVQDSGIIVQVLDNGYARFVEKLFAVMYDLFEIGVDQVDDSSLPNWENLLEVNFFIFGLQAIVEEVKALSIFIHKERKKRLHFRLRHYLPPFLKRRLVVIKNNESANTHTGATAVDDPTSIPIQSDKPEGLIKYRNSKPTQRPKQTWRAPLTKVIKFLQSPPSVYGMKGATAVVLLAAVLFSQTTFFLTWNLSGAVITLLVAISPSLGQTYTSFLINVAGATIGSLWSFVSLKAWRIDNNNVYNAYGLSFFVVLLAIPFVYITQNATAVRTLGILSLLSYSSSMTLSYLYRHEGPSGLPYDPPYVRLYKQLAATSLALTFVLIFSVTIFPNLARRILRERISEIITVIDSFYVDLMSFTYIVLPQHVETDDPEGLSNELLASLSRYQAILPPMFAQLGQLIGFSRVEPRVEGRFDAEKYAAIIQSLQTIVDRIISAKAAVGNEPFLAMKYFTPELMKARHDFRATVRLLLYLYASTMSWKHPLPPNLPSATHARHVLFKSFLSAFLSDTAANQNEVRRSKDFIRFYSWALAMRFCAVELDRLGNLLRDLFGELNDRFDPIEAIEDRGWSRSRMPGKIQPEAENIREKTVDAARAYANLEERQNR